MSILKGPLTVRRYKVNGEVPDDFRAVYESALQDHAFRVPLHSNWEEAQGWATIDGGSDFSDLNRWSHHQYMLVALRTDRRTIPGSTFKRELRVRLEAWCAENGRAKAPASVRGDLRDVLKSEMLHNTIPRMSLVELCWNVADGWVIVASTSDTPNDSIRKLFRRTFGGLELEPETHGLEGESFRSFLEWTWFAAERESGAIDLPDVGVVDGWVGSRLVLKSDSGKAVLTGEAVGSNAAARVEMSAGKRPDELRMHLRREDREFEFTLRGPLLDVVGAKLPQQVKSGDDEVLYERMWLYEELVNLIAQMRTQWAKECTGSDWSDLTRPAMASWVARAFEFDEAGQGRLFGGAT